MKLDPVLRRFFEDASALRLTQREKADMRMALQTHMQLAADMHLTAQEYAEGKDALTTYMRAHPAKDSARFTVFELVYSFFFSRLPALALSALIVVVGSGVVVASAAEGALPGDALYRVKVDVLEPLRERIIQNPEKRVAWKVRKVERRLMEAQSLQERDRLTESHRGVIEQSITREVQELQDSERWDDEEMIIASQQVLEETMEAVASEDDGEATAHPEWRQWKSFVRARQSDVHRSVRERMQTAYGITEDPASAAALAPAPSLMHEVPVPMAPPEPDTPVDVVENAPVMMMRAKELPAENGAEEDEEDPQQEPEERQKKQDDKDLDRMDRGRSDRNNSISEKETQPEAHVESVVESGEQDREDAQEQAIERMEEKRADIKKQLRDFQEEGGLLH